jgi:hypothetical protein
MMANSAERPFDSPEWIFESEAGRLLSDHSLRRYRSTSPVVAHWLPLQGKFPAIGTAVSRLKLRSIILDGEVIAVDENGIPPFRLLQRFQKQPTARSQHRLTGRVSTNRRAIHRPQLGVTGPRPSALKNPRRRPSSPAGHSFFSGRQKILCLTRRSFGTISVIGLRLRSELTIEGLNL